MAEPLVSIWMVTYNHEKYLEQALDGVLMQKTSFRYEIVIGEDCSTDGTRSILQSYTTKYHDIIKPIYQKQNVGAIRNAYEFALPKCKGKYIACLEGDDYWTDPLKLQKQVDFLERNPRFSGTFHNVFIFDDRTHENNREKTEIKEGEYTFKDIFSNNLVPTLSLIFRNNILIPNWLKNEVIADWYLHMLNLKNGPYYCISDYMGVYTKTIQGLFSGLTLKRKLEIRLEFYRKVPELIDESVKKDSRPLISFIFFEMAMNEISFSRKIIYFLKSIIYFPFKLRTIGYRFKKLFL